MGTFGIGIILLGAYLVMCAVENIPPFKALQDLIRNPSQGIKGVSAKKGTGYVSTVAYKQAAASMTPATFTTTLKGGGTVLPPRNDIVGLGKWLQSRGFRVGEHPAFGGVNPVHAKNSKHYRGMALDVNWPDAKAEGAKIDAIIAPLLATGYEVIWRAPGHYDHLHVAIGTLGRITNPY